MAIGLPDARQLSDEALEVLRLRALRGVELGFTEVDMADVLGVTRDTVCRWWTAYASGGIEALPHDRSGRPLGSGRLGSDDQASRIRLLIDARSRSPAIRERKMPATLSASSGWAIAAGAMPSNSSGA